MRRRIIFLVALPAAAGAARLVAHQLEKRGHPEASRRAQKAADAIRPRRKAA